jgi:formylglycine-generating enzyme required for sulfatase activity
MSRKSDEAKQQMLQQRRDRLNILIGRCHVRMKQHLRVALGLVIVSAMLGSPVISRQVGPKAPPPVAPQPSKRKDTSKASKTPPGTRPAPKPHRLSDEQRAQALVELRNSFVQISTGEFMMGSENGDADEKPVHRVRISQSFEMGKYEVTQVQWEAVMGHNPSLFRGANLPVEQASWDDAQQFIQKLNALSDGYLYRLPTEAEWEYACRAGSTGNYAGNLDAMAWYKKNSGGKTHPVGQKQPNAWGLYDMHGNIWEWCEDTYNKGYSSQKLDINLQGPDTYLYRAGYGGSWNQELRFVSQTVTRQLAGRVNRGGGWRGPAMDCRSSVRSGNGHGDHSADMGLRLVRTPR